MAQDLKRNHFSGSNLSAHAKSDTLKVIETVASSSRPQPHPPTTKVLSKRATKLETEAFPLAPLPKEKRVKVNVIAMNKKTGAKPMQQILKNLTSFGDLDMSVFEDRTILEVPVEEWPTCQCLITFFSTGFPIDKIEKYVAMHKPFLINDIRCLTMLLDRKATYDHLEKNHVLVPKHVCVRRSAGEEPHVEEYEDHIVINGNKIEKPFVEKPLDSEDHHIYVYFRSDDGGGRQHLFRKSEDKSSEFEPGVSNIRRDGDYLYEEFIPTGGTDIKVYSVGPNYAYAEARKSPVIDGRVLRGADGKEIRFPILLNKEEKEIVRKIVDIFGMNVCGFDILRTPECSFVCDVNGWSFVKRSPQYYIDCATILHTLMLSACAPQLLHSVGSTLALDVGLSRHPRVSTNQGRPELRCVIAVIRHGDRTPKQKMKMPVAYPEYMALFATSKKPNPRKELKLKSKADLENIISITKGLIDARRGSETDERLSKLRTVVEILTSRPISGINRKLQLKPTKWGTSMAEGKEVETVLEATLVLKWGGELTDLGAKLAEELGEDFRDNMYPQNEFGHGLLRLHSTYRHDLKIYASDEGRVQMTAAAFTRGLLALDADLTPIVASLVSRDDKATALLDDSGNVHAVREAVKSKLHFYLTGDRTDSEIIDQLAPHGESSLVNSLQLIGSPESRLFELKALIEALVKTLLVVSSDPPESPLLPSEGESLSLMIERWRTLQADLYSAKKKTFDISKIPDVYDSVKYDIIHNPRIAPKEIRELYPVAKALADVIVPQEYGLVAQEKVDIAARICCKLISKIQNDLKTSVTDTSKDSAQYQLSSDNTQDVRSPNRLVKTRLYFTSESHLHSITNLIKYGSFAHFVKHAQPANSEQHRVVDEAMERFAALSELNYNCQVIIHLYERTVPCSEADRFYVDLQFSPGQTLVDPGDEREPAVTPPFPIYSGLPLEYFNAFLSYFIDGCATNDHIPIITAEPSSFPPLSTTTPCPCSEVASHTPFSPLPAPLSRNQSFMP